MVLEFFRYWKWVFLLTFAYSCIVQFSRCCCCHKNWDSLYIISHHFYFVNRFLQKNQNFFIFYAYFDFGEFVKRIFPKALPPHFQTSPPSHPNTMAVDKKQLIWHNNIIEKKNNTQQNQCPKCKAQDGQMKSGKNRSETQRKYADTAKNLTHPSPNAMRTAKKHANKP